MRNKSEEHDSIELGLAVHIADVDGAPLCRAEQAVTIASPHMVLSATCQDCLDVWDDAPLEPGNDRD